MEFRLRLPHVAFNRRIGEFAAIHADADGNVLSDDQWQARKETMLPSADDNRFVESLMRPMHAPGTLHRGSHRRASASTTSRATSST